MRWEHDENFVVDLVEKLLGLLKEVVASAGDSDRVPPRVLPIAFAPDEASLFQVIERGHYRRGVYRQVSTERLLGHRAAGPQRHQHSDVPRAYTEAAQALLGQPHERLT